MFGNNVLSVAPPAGAGILLRSKVGKRPMGLFGGAPVAAPAMDTPAAPLPDAGGTPLPAPSGNGPFLGNAPSPAMGVSGLPQAAPNPEGAQGPLGGSIRQPFDYQAAFAALQPQPEKHHTLKEIARIAGPMLMAASGNQAGANAAIEAMARRREEQAAYQRNLSLKLADWRHSDYARQNEADLKAADPFTLGKSRLSYDPATGQVTTIATAPEDFESYAQTLNLKPGTPEYFNAVEDYVLRANGPSALDRNERLDDYRTGNDAKMEGLRYGNRISLEKMRQGNRLTLHGTPSYHDLHPSAHSGGGAQRPTATDGKGNRVEWNGNAWVPVK